jgi:hypothetical protein
VDFYTMNVYLHSRDKFRAYLCRLQNRADEKPLLLGEYGIDLRHGKTAGGAGRHAPGRNGGLAGTCVFSYTTTGGHPITDWAFGLVDHDASPSRSSSGSPRSIGRARCRRRAPSRW